MSVREREIAAVYASAREEEVEGTAESTHLVRFEDRTCCVGSVFVSTSTVPSLLMSMYIRSMVKPWAALMQVSYVCASHGGALPWATTDLSKLVPPAPSGRKEISSP